MTDISFPCPRISCGFLLHLNKADAGVHMTRSILSPTTVHFSVHFDLLLPCLGISYLCSHSWDYTSSVPSFVLILILVSTEIHLFRITFCKHSFKENPLKLPLPYLLTLSRISPQHTLITIQSILLFCFISFCVLLLICLALEDLAM